MCIRLSAVIYGDNVANTTENANRLNKSELDKDDWMDETVPSPLNNIKA